MPNKIKKNNKQIKKEGKGVGKTLKKIGKKVLPVVGALAALGVAGNLAQGYQDYEYNKYMEALDGRGLVEDTRKIIKDVKEGVKKNKKKIGLATLGAIGTYGAYKGLTYPFIEVGKGMNRIVLEKPMEKIPLPVKKDERINKFDYGKLAKYSALAIPAGVLAYYAYKNNIVPNLYNSTRDFFKKDPTMINASTQATEIIPDLMEFSQDTIDALDIPEATLKGLNRLRDRIEMGTQTPQSFINEQVLNKIAKETAQLKAFDPAQIVNETNELITMISKSSIRKKELLAIAEKIGLNPMEYKIYTKKDLATELMGILNDKMGSAQDILQANVEQLGRLDEKMYSALNNSMALIEEGKLIGKGIKKQKKPTKKAKGKGLFSGMKSVEKYKNII